ncbi:MAG TPA: class I SAM-dependent methyltransferase [Micropepsaceae bacterium]|jgi:2-polyprenyl-3-methyl-5-hydroxy-6-metoxy-1,4-benzoquinol methylase|nr:class I SAM-dependent methyltransferase [Micropepsaceae bacterium]
MTDRRTHWDDTYTAKADSQVSWYQPHPDRSLALIRSAARDPAAAIIDVGGGASRLVDALISEGYSDVTVLDISKVALEHAKARLKGLAGQVSWIVADITQWQPERNWDIWHDRAVFHFLTDAASQDAYIAALRQGTLPGAAVIMATFALAGPERCSGLPVQRYSPATLAARLGPDFTLQAEAVEMHPTPFGTTQEFAYTAFQRA